MALTDKRQAFVNEYLICWNASEAARRAGYSEDTAGSQGQRLLKNVEVSEEIRRRISEKTMTADEVLIRLTDHARASMDDCVSFVAGVKLPFIDLAKAHENGKMHLIKKLKYTDQGNVEFELHDSQAALALLAKHYKLLTDKQEISGADGAPLVGIVKMSVDEL